MFASHIYQQSPLTSSENHCRSLFCSGQASDKASLTNQLWSCCVPPWVNSCPPSPAVGSLAQGKKSTTLLSGVASSSCTLALGQVLHHPREQISMFAESGFPFSRVLLGSLHSAVPLSCAGVNESLFVQLFEDEKRNGRALLLLPGMKSSVPNPTVLCLATGCHSCSTHNAAEMRKEKCLPSSGQQPHFQSHYLFCEECVFVEGLGVFPCVSALLILIFGENEQQLCFLCMLSHRQIRSKMNIFMEGGAELYKILITASEKMDGCLHVLASCLVTGLFLLYPTITQSTAQSLSMMEKSIPGRFSPGLLQSFSPNVPVYLAPNAEGRLTSPFLTLPSHFVFFKVSTRRT